MKVGYLSVKITKVNKTELIARANEISKDTLMETLGIQFVDLGEDYIEATMPVNSKVHQPAGLLHGGASVALAESVGSCGSQIILRDPSAQVVGIEINANHIRSVRSGTVKAQGKIIHKGKTTHVWEIRIIGPEGKLISVCRLTNMIIQSK
jgi:uncharacterized protein (TIGR00369 family)